MASTAAKASPDPEHSAVPELSPSQNVVATGSSMTPSERRTYGRMAETMTYYHNHFKSTYQTLYTACSTNHRPANMSMKQFLNTASTFVSQLSLHHSIEEAHVFPLLAQRMPAFKQEMELLEQHKLIHKGIDELEAYVQECRKGERELRLGEMKEVLEGFGGVLMGHLDEEVGNLGAENMRKYWNLDEMRAMPM